MKRHFLMRAAAAILSLALAAQSAAAYPVGSSAPAPNPTPIKNLPNVNVLRPIGDNAMFSEDFSAATEGTSFSSTSRVAYTTHGPVSVLALLLKNRGAGAGAESNGFNTVIRQACVEYPLGTTAQCFSVAGNTSWSEAKDAPYTQTDQLGVSIPPATPFAIRLFQRVAQFPSSPSASAAAGGALTAGTYFYELTCTDTGVESFHSAEVSATTSGTNLSAALTWTPPPACNQVNVYRGATSGAERFLTTLAGAGTGWTDSGYVNPVLGASPPSAQLGYVWNRFGRTGWSENEAAYGGNQANVVGSTGAITGIAGPCYCFFAAPTIVLGDDTSTPAVLAMGDSIMAGTGITQQSAGYLGNAPAAANWFDAGLVTAGGINAINASIGSTKIADIAGALKSTSLRLYSTRFAGYVISELGTNDMSAGATWQQIAANHLVLAQSMKNRGVRYVLTTLLPVTNSTDGFLTVTHQSVAARESTVRLPYNAWVRAGSPVDGSGNPVAPGTSGSSNSPLIYKVYDLAAAVEVNSSGVPTMNGGFWPAPVAAAATGTLTGSPTTTNLPVVATLTISQYNGYLLKMTSGAQSGSVALININSASAITAFANGANMDTGIPAGVGLASAPAAGDTFSLYQTFTPDGLHPRLVEHGVIANNFAAWAAANLTPFQ